MRLCTVFSSFRRCSISASPWTGIRVDWTGLSTCYRCWGTSRESGSKRCCCCCCNKGTSSLASRTDGCQYLYVCTSKQVLLYQYRKWAPAQTDSTLMFVVSLCVEGILCGRVRGVWRGVLRGGCSCEWGFGQVFGRVWRGCPVDALQCNPLGVLERGMLPINLVSIFWCSSPPHNPVYTKRVDLSLLTFSLSSHRHSFISLLFSSRFIVS